jgi:flagellar biosynthesis regulator FlbT
MHRDTNPQDKDAQGIGFSLRAGGSAIVNGAVMRAPGGGRFTILNDARLLIEDHFPPAACPSTPGWDLYKAIAADVAAAPGAARPALAPLLEAAMRAHPDRAGREALELVRRRLADGRPVEALKALRPLLAA